MCLQTRRIRDRIQTVELDYMRRNLQLTRRDKIYTEGIWKRAVITCSITKILENRALNWEDKDLWKLEMANGKKAEEIEETNNFST